jgi:glycosyltransferase involved in cell wall biosynthesis
MFGWEFPPFNSGGLGVACLGLTRSLAQRGFEVLFVMPKKLDVQSPYARMIFADIDGVEGIAVDSMLTPYISSGKYARERGESGIYGRDLFSEVERYRATGAQIARDEEFDVIYAHDWLAFGAGMEAKKATGKPLIVHVHATEFDRCGGESGVNPHVFAIEKRGMEEADSVIAVSELTKNIIVSSYGIPAEKVRVVHNGIDESTVPSGLGMRRLRSLKDSGYKIVLFLGRITLQKGPDYFLRAAKRVLERDPNVMFVMSGAGDMEDSIMQLSASLGISKNIIFTGFLTGTDRHEMYLAADLFVMPSVSEPFGITPLESMKLGTPVLISKQSGVSEVVRHALKVDFWDIDEMANMILSVVGHPALHASLSENARSEAEKLTWADAAIKVDSIVHELVA